ncbi:MAG: transporter substrate-binding domain-containing protein [Lachnospiraceae bacterium]|nr:transporter substrate-binding domain-containing protein [Lachnospiraceae bacterium]
MKTRKLAALGLALTMSLSLFGSMAYAEEETETETEAELVITEDIQEIIDRGILRVGVKNAVEGFGYQDTLTGEYSGMEIDIATMIAEELGVDVEFTTVTAATRTELLDSGDIDCVIATFTITDERRESWDFSTPYYTDHVTVLVKDSSEITTLEDLVDTTVGVSSGSTSARSLVEAMIEAEVISGDDYDAETFDAALWTEGVSFRQYDDYPAISTALEADEVDAFCVDKSILAIYKTEGRSYIDAEFAPQEYGVATTKDSGFSAYVDILINRWLDDGTIDGLIEEYALD